MTRSHRKAIGLFALTIITALTGCDSADRLQDITTPTVAYDGGSNSSSKHQKRRLLRRRLAKLGEEVASVEVNRNGGELTLGDHKLIIPRKAVERRTVFAMRVIPGDYIRVELFAWDAKTLRRIEEFDKPIRLVLSYADASPMDENKLGVAYLADNDPEGRQERMGGTAVDRIKKTVSALLPHFSEFAITAN
jgi:hypothetical protein